jgi:hypothetical protein
MPSPITTTTNLDINILTRASQPWLLTNKGDQQCRILADRHYSRQTPGHPAFTRPGYNMVLWLEGPKGQATWVWFRPKWESGIKGTMRKDGLFAIECTLFRNESGLLSSDLIIAAESALLTWERAMDVPWPDGAITGINCTATQRRRSKHVPPGYCYLMAGWKPFNHNKSNRADEWLRLTMDEFPPPIIPQVKN